MKPRRNKIWNIFLLAFAAFLPGASARSVVLPVEVYGKAGASKSVTLDVPTLSAPQINGLWLRIHGLTYPGKVSVQLNSGPLIALMNSTVTVIGKRANACGGIGGAYPTLAVKLPVSAGSVPPGKNTVRVTFNGTDGFSSGFRVIGVNFLVGDTKVLPSSKFTWVDPAKWKPIYTDPAKIALGETLWRTAPLKESPLNPKKNIRPCGSCHAQDGRDLKYFNYSDYDIVERCKFHMLTGEQGKCIASYIRSLKTPAPGRPWNPPFQPGPGLDAKDWTAGAGIDAVLDDDLDTLKYIPSYAASAHQNVRETPIGLQLPDWNGWLPRIHPADFFGQPWTDSEIEPRYQSLRITLSDTANLPAYLASPAAKTDLNTWQGRRYEFLKPYIEGPSVVWSAQLARAAYSAVQWQMVHMWEMVQEFSLEGMGSYYFGPQAEKKTIPGQIAFNLSPNMLNIPDDFGIGGSAVTNEYFSSVWYHTQLILNPGNGKSDGNSPVDDGYTWGKFKDFSQASSMPELGRYTLFFVKRMQEHHGKGVNVRTGFNVNQMTADWAFRPTPYQQWVNVPAATRVAAQNSLVKAWLDEATSFPAVDYYAQGYTSAAHVPVATYNSSDPCDRWLWTLPILKSSGIDQALIDRWAKLGQALNPGGPWALEAGAP